MTCRLYPDVAMKHVIAFIKPHKVPDFTLTLHRVERPMGMSADVRGFGRGCAQSVPDPFSVGATDFVPRIHMEAVVADEIAHEIVDTIRREAHTDLRGDGKIYASPVEAAV